MKDMTEKEIVAAGKKYDNLHNEGGEGFNPYWAELERREMAEARKIADSPKTREEQISRLHDKIRKECGSVAREWGGEEIDKKQAAYYAEIKRLEDEIEEEFAVEWTREVTLSRRIVWNDFVNSKLAGGRMTPEKFRILKTKTDELGWGLDELKRAVKLHNLPAYRR